MPKFGDNSVYTTHFGWLVYPGVRPAWLIYTGVHPVWLVYPGVHPAWLIYTGVHPVWIIYPGVHPAWIIYPGVHPAEKCSESIRWQKPCHPKTASFKVQLDHSSNESCNEATIYNKMNSSKT